jgi:hypothetical protein
VASIVDSVLFATNKAFKPNSGLDANGKLL